MDLLRSAGLFSRSRLLRAIPLVAVAATGAWVAPARSQNGSTLHTLAVEHQISSAYTPQEIATAYDFTPLYKSGIDGTGQKIALIEADALSTGDLSQFDGSFGLSSPKIKQYYVGGKKFKLRVQDETNMDVEWVHALAPGASIQIYYIKHQDVRKGGWTEMGNLLRKAAANGASTITISLGVCGTSRGYTAVHSALSALIGQGISVFVASGDDGDLPGPAKDCGNLPGVGYPASDPSVVSVGGTSLQLNDDSTISNEVAWKLSGGGLAVKFHRATWQQAATLPNDVYRWAPDVSFLADPATGVRVYSRSRWHQYGGTSLGAPAWAAAWALIRESGEQAGKSIGAAPASIYQIGNSSSYGQAFHDITEGSNGQYQAGPGWDAVTGWGTPDVANLAAAVQSL